MKQRIGHFFISFVVFSLIFFGCAGLEVAMENSQVQVQSNLDNVPFFDSRPGQKVFITVRNFSPYRDLDMVEGLVRQKYQRRGYVVVDNPDKADWILQAKIVNITKEDFSARQVKGTRSSQGAVEGAIGGALAGGAIGDDIRGALVGALLGGVMTGAANLTVNSWVKLGYLTIITDMQVQERKSGGVQSQFSGVQNIGNVKQKYQTKETSNWMKYRFQALTRAKKANLKWEDCKDVMLNEIVRLISSLL